MAGPIFTVTFDLNDPNRSLEKQRADEISRLKQNYRNRIYKAKRQYEDEYTKPNGNPKKIAAYKAKWDQLEADRASIASQIDSTVEAEYQKALAAMNSKPTPPPKKTTKKSSTAARPKATKTAVKPKTIKASSKPAVIKVKGRRKAATQAAVQAATTSGGSAATSGGLLSGTSPLIQAANSIFGPVFGQTKAIIAANNNAPNGGLLTVTTSPASRMFGLHTTDEIKNQLAPRLYALPLEQRKRFKTMFDDLLYDRDQRLMAGQSTAKLDAQIRALSNRMYARYEKKVDAEKKAAKKFRIGELDRTRLYPNGRLGMVDRNGLFGVASQLINAYGGADTAKMRRVLSNQMDAIRRGDTRSLAPVKAIIRQTRAREKSMDVANQRIRVRGSDSGDPWHYVTHAEAQKMGLDTLDALLQGGFIDQQNWATRVSELRGAYSKAIHGETKEPLQTQVRNALADKHRMEATKLRAQKDQYAAHHQAVFSQTATRGFLGVQRTINWADDAAMNAAISDLEAVAKVLPGGAQFKDTVSALRFQNANVSGAEREKVYHNLMRLSSDLDQQARRNPNAYRIYADRLRSSPNAADKMLALEVMDQSAMLNNARVNNYHYQQKSFWHGVGQMARGLSPIGHREIYDADGYLIDRQFGVKWGRGRGGGRQIREGAETTARAVRMMFRENLPELSKTITSSIMNAYRMAGSMLMPVAMYGGVAAGAVIGGALKYGVGAANQRQSLKTMYDVSIPNSWKKGMTYEQFEAQNFSVARDMRTNAYALQENALRLATAVNTARYSTGANAGKPIVTDFQDVMRMSRNMAILARISGVSDSDLAAFMLQIQQGIGKGKLDTMDIKPMENRSPMMANLWAQKFLGLSGAAEMFRMMDEGRGDRTKGITPEKFLPRMASAEVEKELMDMLRSTARSWNQIFTVVGSDLQHGMLNFTKKVQDAANGKFGSDVLGVSQYIAEEKLSDTGTLGDIVSAIIPSLDNLPKLLTNGIHTFGKFMLVASDVTSAVKGLVPIFTGFGAALLLLISGVQSVAALISAVPAGLVRGIATAVKGGSFWEGFKGGLLDVFDAPLASIRGAGELFESTGGIINALDSIAKLEGNIGTEANKINIGQTEVKHGGTDKPMNVEDTGLTGTTGEIAKDTKEIKKNGAKLTSIQLELLKQVSGRAVVNNVTRVAPNIVANVGTIKSGVEYEQFMADLNKTVRLAAMNMAY